MEKQLDLTLTNRWKATVLVLIIIGLTLPLLLGILTVFAHSKLWGSLLGVVGLAAFVLLPERMARYFSAEHATVAFDATGITVSYAANGKVRRLDFAEIVSYYSGLEFDFTINPRRGSPLMFHLNSKLHPQGMGPLVALRQHFDWAANHYNRAQLRATPATMPQLAGALPAAFGPENPAAVPIRRLGFATQPAAAFWLVALAGLTVWMGCRALQTNASEGTWGGFLFVGLGLIIYGAYWWHKRQN